MEKSLEEIFWKDGKFVKENEEEVKPEAIGRPEIFIPYEDENITNLNLKKLLLKIYNSTHQEKEYNKINAFLRGNLENPSSLCYAIQFYKI